MLLKIHCDFILGTFLLILSLYWTKTIYIYYFFFYIFSVTQKNLIKFDEIRRIIEGFPISYVCYRQKKTIYSKNHYNEDRLKRDTVYNKQNTRSRQEPI